MNAFGFSLLEILVGLVLLSGFMLLGFDVLHHLNLLEQLVQQTYQGLGLTV